MPHYVPLVVKTAEILIPKGMGKAFAGESALVCVLYVLTSCIDNFVLLYCGSLAKSSAEVYYRYRYSYMRNYGCR